MKAAETEGEKRGRIELGEEEEAEGFDGDMGTSDEQQGEIATKGNQIFIQNILILSLIDFCFIELQKEKLHQSVALCQSVTYRLLFYTDSVFHIGGFSKFFVGVSSLMYSLRGLHNQ